LGDALARNVTAEVRRGLADPVAGLDGEFKSLAMLGITTTKDGSLTLDEAKLTEALNKDFNGVGAVFGSENGVAARLAKSIEVRLSTTGDIATRNASLDILSDWQYLLGFRYIKSAGSNWEMGVGARPEKLIRSN
jgi:flagellar hook-associated protein 2